jgi:hypothetical protein
MIILNVPFAEKDKAKALGARWNSERKVWYVPDGENIAPFEKWHAPGQPSVPVKVNHIAKKAPVRVDSYSGTAVVGKYYVELNHDCNPFIECPECKPKLEAAGWFTAGSGLK